MLKDSSLKINNSVLSDVLGLPSNQTAPYWSDMTSPLYDFSPIYLTFDWVKLTNAYKSLGFVQTAVNQIVDDAFRNEGLIIDTITLDTKELEKLKQALYDEGDIEALKDAIKWGLLYGGGVLMAQTEQRNNNPLNKKNLEGTQLKFLSSDRWHCYPTEANIEIAQTFNYTTNPAMRDKPMLTFDRSRIGLFTGVRVPDHIRLIMGGWGLSILEAVLKPLLGYLKSINVSLELLDEAKIDVFKIMDLASAGASIEAQRQIKERLSIATREKNYKSSLALDVNDDYLQKQISFSGIPDMIMQIQYLVCSALKRPYSKIFGKGSSGFSSGEDDLENYNTIVDAEVRTPATKLIQWVVNLRCLQLFGVDLPDFRPKWKPLRVMSEKDMSEINSRKAADYMQLADRGIMSKQMVAKKLTEDGYILFSDEEIKQIDNTFNAQTADNPEDLLID